MFTRIFSSRTSSSLLRTASTSRRSLCMVARPLSSSSPAKIFSQSPATVVRAPVLLPSRLFHSSPSSTASSVVFNTTEDTFKEEVLNSSVPVLVDFHAGWCGPCQSLGPVLEKVVEGANGAVKLAKVDVDEEADLANYYEVESIPTVLVVSKGEVVDKFVGSKDEHFLQDLVTKLSP
eukprot:Nk52_evm4s689 gene=Nk52_evmTU4s689